MPIDEKLELADHVFQEDNLPFIKDLIYELEREFSMIDMNIALNQKRSFNFGSILIDYGSRVEEKGTITKGIERIQNFGRFFLEANNSVTYFYNLANGYSALRKLSIPEGYENGYLPNEFLNEIKTYRIAIDLASKNKLEQYEKDILPQLFTNYGNSLDDLGRPIEALEYINKAIVLNPNNAITLANKAMILTNLVFFAQENKHLFVLEAKRFINLALKNSPTKELEEYLIPQMEKVQEFIDKHPEKLSLEKCNKPTAESDFQKFLGEFCFRNGLYLTPSTIIGERDYQIFGDPLFISTMRSNVNDNSKFDRYVTFFNQIKQDYIFARYLLVQSQYRSNLADVIDQDVVYYYPSDYSITSSYGEMVKISYRLTVDTLDKIACFIWDYCKVISINISDVNFRNIFSSRERPNEFRSDLMQYKNKYLFGLMSLALDLKQGGYYSSIYDRRNALTHRFISLHSESIGLNDGRPGTPKIIFNDFINETIQTLQLLKSAIIYLLLFIDIEERKTDFKGLVFPISPIKSEGFLRWTPIEGDC